MNKGKAVVSFSGGKDCTLAMYRMMKAGYEIAALLVTFDDEESCFHKIPRDILYTISQSLEIPLVEIDRKCKEILGQFGYLKIKKIN